MTVSIELANLAPVTTILHVRPVGMRASPPSDEVLKSVGMKKTLDPAKNYYLRLAGASVFYSIYAAGVVVGAFFLLGPFTAAFFGFMFVAAPCVEIFDRYFGPFAHEAKEENNGSNMLRLKSRHSESRTQRANYPMTVEKNSTPLSIHRQHQKNSFNTRGRQTK